MSSPFAENPYEAPRAESLDVVGAPVVPAGVGGKLILAFRLVFGDLPLLASVVLTVWLPLNTVLFFVGRELGADDNPMVQLRLSNLVEGIFGPITTGAALLVFLDRMRGRRPAYGRAMSWGFARWGPLFATRFVAGLLILGGLILLIVPGVILAIRFAAIDPVVVLEEVSGGEARSRSRAITHGRGLQILLALFATFLMVLSTGLVLGLPVGFIEQLDNPFYAIATDCVVDVVVLLMTAVVFLFYLEARPKMAASPVKDDGLVADDLDFR